MIIDEVLHQFLAGISLEQQQIVRSLHQWLCNFPGVYCQIRYKIPFYYRHTWVCYLNPIVKQNAIELVFIRANELSNEQGWLDFKGRKQAAGVIITSLTDFPYDTLQEVFQEALLLDEQVAYTAPKRKKPK